MVGEELSRVLEPTFIKKLPSYDAWEHPLLIVISAESYSIVSHGKGGSPDEHVTTGTTGNLENDIYMANGQFTVYPEGAQH